MNISSLVDVPAFFTLTFHSIQHIYKIRINILQIPVPRCSCLCSYPIKMPSTAVRMEVCRKPAIASHLEHCLCTAPPEPGGPKWTVGAGDRWIIFSSKLPQHLILRLTHSPTCVLCHEKSGKKNPGILAFRKFNKILCVELFYSVVWRAVDLELKSMWHHVFRKKKTDTCVQNYIVKI